VPSDNKQTRARSSAPPTGPPSSARRLRPTYLSNMYGDARRSLARGAIFAAGLLLVIAICASAAAALTLPGAPLAVSVGPLGECQSSYPGRGNNFYPESGPIGDCGFFLGFPEAGDPAPLQKKVFGFQGIKGPGLVVQYTAIGQGAVTGTGTAADPYRVVTTFKVSDAAKAEKNDYALIEDTTSYVNGEPQFTSTFDVENITGESGTGLSPAPSTPLKFHAIYAGDMLTGDSDFGTGVLLAGPPREIGGTNESTGVFGGFVEAPAPSPPWSDFQSGCWDVVPEIEGRCPATSLADGGIWAAVRGAADEAPVFDNDVDPNSIDNAAGVSWDDHLNRALKPGEHAIYTIVNRAQIPTGLTVGPSTQTRIVGQTATVLVTASDNSGAPYANRRIVYSVGSTNPKSGSVLTNSAGVATIGYVGTAAGVDTVQIFLDFGGSGSRISSDPASTAQVTWLASAATPSSRYRLQSVHTGADGTVTIVLVPLQDGTATLQVSEPTAAISRSRALAAKHRGCKHGQIRIKGRCRPRLTVSGVASVAARAGSALKLVVKASRKLKKALKRGRSVQLTAVLTYSSGLGGKPTAQAFHLKVKPTKRHR
jgi:hypothetical protein